MANLRHAELVSASIPATAPAFQVWTLKQVQGDDGHEEMLSYSHRTVQGGRMTAIQHPALAPFPGFARAQAHPRTRGTMNIVNFRGVTANIRNIRG